MMENDFPFITNEDTIRHITQSKVMFIMRGLPGSGKSTIVSLITSKYKTAVVCSADEFFLNSKGNYNYDTKRLPEAHDQCQRKANDASQSGINVVIIDNTNVMHWELKYYADIAAKNNYTVVVVIPQTSWRFDAAELAKRNKHHVPMDTLSMKIKKFEKILPIYWGWFTNEADTSPIMRLAKKYYTLCIENLPEFKRVVSDVTYDKIYSRSGASTHTLHCTSLFAGEKQLAQKSLQYSKRPAVQKSMGGVQTLHVIGIIITPRTVGARIALDRDQMLLWGQEDESSRESSASGTASRTTVDDLASSLQQTNLCGSCRVDQGQVEGLYEKLKDHPKFAPISGPGSRAHFTIGWASHSKPVQTGFDQLLIIEKEQECIKDDKFVSVKDACLRYYGDGLCVIYFDKPMRVNTLFSGKY